MQRLAQGLPIGEVDPDANFYVLGLAPNAARLSVRFFQRDTFGAMLDTVGRESTMDWSMAFATAAVAGMIGWLPMLRWGR